MIGATFEVLALCGQVWYSTAEDWWNLARYPGWPAIASIRRFSSAVEQRFCKPKVGSSILSTGTSVSEWCEELSPPSNIQMFHFSEHQIRLPRSKVLRQIRRYRGWEYCHCTDNQFSRTGRSAQRLRPFSLASKAGAKMPDRECKTVSHLLRVKLRSGSGPTSKRHGKIACPDAPRPTSSSVARLRSFKAWKFAVPNAAADAIDQWLRAARSAAIMQTANRRSSQGAC